tara:strand:+ start:525 stop:1133 length:609 start_codon:yes stop_codon:yes gene_type:complete
MSGIITSIPKIINVGKDILGMLTTVGKGVKNKTKQTKNINRRNSIQNKTTGQIKTNQGTGTKVGVTQAQDKVTGQIKTIKKSRQAAIDNKVRNAKALAGGKNIIKTGAVASAVIATNKAVDNKAIAKPILKPIPKRRPKDLKTNTQKKKKVVIDKKQYMVEGSGLPYSDKKPKKLSNVEFKSEVIKKSVGGKLSSPSHNRLY